MMRKSMKRLLLFFMTFCVSIGTWADITISSRDQNGVAGYGVYGFQPGELAALLNGTYTGTVSGDGTIADVKSAAFVKLGSSNESLNQADIEALSTLTGVQYLRMDNCTLSGTVDFSQIGVGSSSLLEVTMPEGVTRAQVEAANTQIKSVATGVKLVVGVSGELVGEEKTHYWYTIPNVGTFEYTDAVAEGQTSIEVSDYAIMADLTLVSGYPKYSYTNTKNDNKVYEVDEAYLASHTVNVWGSNYFAPSPLDVKLTASSSVSYYYTVDDTNYNIDTEQNSKISYDSENDRYYVSDSDGAWSTELYNATQVGFVPANSVVTRVETPLYTYTWRENSNEVTKTYTGTIPDPDANGNYVVSLENNYDGNNGYKFDLTTSYLYTYTDKNGDEQTYNQYDEDGKIQIDTYSGTLELTTTTETEYSLIVDGAVACVNVEGSLPDALNLFTDNNGDNTLTNYKSAETVTIIGDANDTDLASLSNFTQPKLVDLSDAEFTGNSAGTTIGTAFENVAAASKPVVIIPTPENSTDATKCSNDEYGLQTKNITYAYYLDANKKMMNAWCPNAAMVLQNLEPVVDNTMALTFLPNYGNDGNISFNSQYQYMLMFANDQSASSNLTSADVLGKLPFGSIDFTWVFYGDVFCDYSELNEDTHYIVVQQNSTSSSYDFTADDNSTPYKYNENIWVVSTYKGAAAPYATQAYYDGRSLNTAAYASDNGTGFEENGTTANITYIRTAGKLSGAANLVSDLQKYADRTVIVGNVNSSDIAAINVMRNSVLDLSGAILSSSSDMNSLQNQYIQYLALPYNSDYDVASFKASQCTGLLGVGKYDTTNKHLYLQSYQEGGMVNIMSCLAKATGIEYVTAAGEMNARDLSANTNCFDANGHYTFTYAETTEGGVTGLVPTIATGLAQINNASIQGALNGRIATYFKGLDITGVTLKQYDAEPSDGQAKIYTYDNTYQDDLSFNTMSYMQSSSNKDFEYLRLPTDASVWRLPAASLRDGIYALSSICIPGQYREIGAFVFAHDNSLMRVTTTRVANGNGSGAAYEEYGGSLTGAAGGNTITLPPSLTLLEAGAFANVEHFTDVYVTSDAVPACQKDAFGSGTYYGWGGFNDQHDGMGQRTDYGKDSDNTSDKAFGVLHWTANYTLADVKKLTDIERVYSMRDREGKEDDRGNVLTWPTLSQINRAYALACTGYLDGAWMPYVDGATEPTYDTNGVVSNTYAAEGNAITQEQGDDHYTAFGSPTGETYTDYIGWHQFVLVGSWSYAEKFEYKPWNTMCIPYNMTYEQMVGMYAVTHSVSATNKKIIVDAEGYPIANAADGVDENGEVATDAATLLPTVSTLTSVKRNVTYKQDNLGEYVIENGVYVKKTAEELANIDVKNRYKANGGMITLQFTEGMVTKAATDEDGKVYNWKINGSYTWSSSATNVGEWEENTDKYIMKAGYPYHLKVFVPLGTENIRTYAMNELQSAGVSTTNEAPNNEWIVPTTGNAGGGDLKYKFKGYYDVSASTVALPMYSYFLWVPKTGESLWYRYEQSWGEAWGQNNPIASYAAIIGLIGENNTWPEYDLMLTDKNSGAQAKGVLMVDFGDDSETETTGISDVQADMQGFATAGKVYNMSGQVVSETGSLQSLGKGIYVINGKKYIVK